MFFINWTFNKRFLVKQSLNFIFAEGVRLRSVFRALSNIYDGAFTQMVNG